MNLILDLNFVHCSPFSLWTVKMKDGKRRRLRKARAHSKKIIWQIDFLRFGACGLCIVLYGTSTLLVRL